MAFKRANTSNLMKFQCCFLISKFHQNCNAMPYFTVYVMYLGTILFALQYNVFISLLRFSFSDAAGKVTNTVSLLNFQQSKKHFKIITIKKILLPSRIEICSLDLKFQWQILQDEGQATLVQSSVKDIHKIHIKASFQS